MTQHHDPVHPDEGDIGDIDEIDEIETLTADDDAYVSALLAGLPAVVMPTDVAARLDAALAEAALTGMTDPESEVPVAAAATVVPIASARSSRWRDPRILKVAAAVVLVLGGGGLAIKVISGGSSSETSTAASAGGAARAAEKLSLNSAHAYTSDTLATDVRALVAGSLPKAPTTGQDSAAGGTPAPVQTPVAPSTSPGTASNGKLYEPLRQLTTSVNTLAPCIAALEEGITAVTPYAIDAGTYDGRPALIVVLPNKEDAAYYDVFVVGAKCGQGNDADFIAYRRVPRS
jgi:hypothetical protein